MYLLPSLEGRGWGWVGVRQVLRQQMDLPTPNPSLSGKGILLGSQAFQ